MKESYPPGLFQPDEPYSIVNIEDDAAYEMSRRLAKEEGILVGMSAGAAMKVALDEAQSLGRGTVVALLPDGGERYLSTSLFVSETVAVPLHFFNTLTAKVEPFEPVRPGKVAMYSCGPSLDGPTDLGLCRRVVFSDLLRRHLEDRGYEVKHVMNLGDIDDRTVNECLKVGGKWKEFTDAWERAFFHDLGYVACTNGLIIIRGRANMSATWWNRLAICWNEIWPTRNCVPSISGSASFPG